MHSLDQIKKINDKAVANAKRISRRDVEHCSYTGTIDNGLVLHSAAQRSTVLIRGAAAKVFVQAWLDIPSLAHGNKHQIQARRDHLVESYF
jgi:hypothetical protein